MANELTQKQITSNVATRIEAMKNEGLLIAPNYSVSNALSSAYYALKNSNSGNLLEKCTSESIYNALLDMVTQGLSPAKTQCYFIPYGNSVKLNRSYFGTMKVVKQLPEVKDIYAKIIYEGDDFQAENTETGWKFVKHDSNWKNQDNPIEGAYCIIKKVDGEDVMTIMTKKEIDKSWSKAKTKNVQNDFPQEMAKRTVINRAAKQFFNTSDDNDLFVDAVNRTTENEYDNDRQVKDVTPQETNSLDDLIGHQSEKIDAPSNLKDVTDDLHSEPEKTLTDENKAVLGDTSYPADEIPDFDQETGEIMASEGNLFDNLGDLMP
ncbi:recombinase RecT [Streptococcus equi]|uniref:Recombinase RecT n=1 Tax=Streptococcus equi subsp. ruminatorum TaxID=254358 RepID=A0A6M1KQE6_9STRE|nr:RecT family recombinase [Streptococcus equi]NGL84133.1 recombinase RecT [Streptococcus equi subsp. ruminatorum]